MAIVFNGINIVGVVKCAQVVYREHVHFVMSITAFLMCVVVFLLPMIVYFICPDNTLEQVTLLFFLNLFQWSRFFFIIAIVVALCSIPFIFLAKDKPVVW